MIETGVPEEVICDQLICIFMAGRDITSSVLTSLFMELARRLEVVARLRVEIAGPVDEGGRTTGNLLWWQPKQL